MIAEEEGMIAGTITEVHDQREGTEVLVRKDRVRALGQKVITVAHDQRVEIKVLVRKDRIADPVRITAARDLRVVIADPVRKVDRIAAHVRKEQETRQRRSKKNLDVIKRPTPQGWASLF